MSLEDGRKLLHDLSEALRELPSEPKNTITHNLIVTKQTEPDDLKNSYYDIAKQEQYFNQGIANGYRLLNEISDKEYQELISYIHDFDMSPEY